MFYETGQRILKTLLQKVWLSYEDRSQTSSDGKAGNDGELENP